MLGARRGPGTVPEFITALGRVRHSKRTNCSSGSFHLIFSDRSQCQVTETLESETVDEVGRPWSSADAEEAAAFERCPGSFSHRRCGKS